MSGPKIDEAELERRKQAELEELRQKKLRALNEHSRAVSRAESFADSIKAFLNNSLERFTSDQALRFDVQAMRAAANTAEQQIQTALSVQTPNETASIRMATETLDRRLKEFQSVFDRAKSAFEIRVTERTEVLKNQQERERLSQKLASSKEENRVFKIIHFALEESEAVVPFEWDTEGLISEMKFLLKHPSIGQYRETMLAVLSDLQRAAEQNKQTLLSQYTALRSEIWQHIREFTLYYRHYHALYFAWAQIRFRGQAEFPPPQSQSSFQSIKELESEINRLRQAYKKEDEMAFIRETMNTIMREFGYLTLEPIQLRNVQTEKTHYLAEALRKGQAPLHIEVDENGRFMMEVQSLDGSNGDNTYEAAGLSFGEKRYITDQQTAFCRQYPQMIKRLKELGILFTPTKTHLKPGELCAKIRIKGKQSSYAQFKTKESEKDKDAVAFTLKEREQLQRRGCDEEVM